VQIIHGYEGLTPEQKGHSVALGNFDGVHRGHAAVIAAARDLAPDAPIGVVSFDPHPRQFFQPDAAPFILTPLAQKAAKVARLKVDTLYVVPFNAALSAMTPEAFVRDVLVNGLGIVGVAVGSDFRFGAKRAGDSATLQQLGNDHGYQCQALPEVSDESGGLFSSSSAREALRDGRPEDAATILGAPHTIGGPILTGDQRGRTIGFATANLSLDGLLTPKFGVYAITATLPDGRTFNGVANMGMRPTFEKTIPILEAHLFDFAEDIYGQDVSVALHHFIRPEQKFDGIDALKAQIAADAEAAREWLADA
jgi:riboflavin kinase/FMN adenylyltransferase